MGPIVRPRAHARRGLLARTLAVLLLGLLLASAPASGRAAAERTPEAAAAAFGEYVDAVLTARITPPASLDPADAAQLSALQERGPSSWTPAGPAPRAVAISGDPAAPDQVMVEVTGRLHMDGRTSAATLGGTVAWQDGRWVLTGLRPAAAVPDPTPTTAAELPGLPSYSPRTADTSRERLLIVGDSLAQGSSGDYTWRYRLWTKLQATAPGVRFVGTTDRLYDHLHDTYDSTNYAEEFAGDAHSARWGSLLRDEVTTLAGRVERTRATVLVLALGINDVVFTGASATEVAALARKAVRRARAAAPGIDVVLGAVLSRYDFFVGEYQQRAVSARIADRLADLAAAMDSRRQRVVVAPTRAGWDPQLLTYDGTHPDATGEAYLAQRMSQSLARIGIGSPLPDISGPTAWAQQPDAPLVTVGGDAPTDITLAWSREPTGATAMFLQHREAGSFGWTTLPYPVSVEGWTYPDLEPGTTYDFRIIPVKGRMVGLPSPAAVAEVPLP